MKHVPARQTARRGVLHVVAADDARVVARGQLRGGRGRESGNAVRVCVFGICDDRHWHDGYT